VVCFVPRWSELARLMKRIARPALLAVTAFASGCYQFHLVGPTQPDPVPAPQLVSVTVEYTQMLPCTADSSTCQATVTFDGSWMQPGAQFSLVRDPGNGVWRGTVYAVPVNFPPHGDPYRVRVHDPTLANGATEGWTGRRLVVGGESVRSLAGTGTPTEHGVVYVDANGYGHNVF
jgi:hypothetical protein